jgi:hypothetical protein
MQGMTAWHDAGFTFDGNCIFDKNVLLRRHTALEDCSGGERDRAKPERLLQNDVLETVAKIIDSSGFDTDEKLYFIHMAAGRAINADLYERGRNAEKKIRGKSNPSALERKLAAGITDTGVMDNEDYAREEAGVQAMAAEERIDMKFQCSVCKKMYKTLFFCQKHGNDKHPPAMNFRAVNIEQQRAADDVDVAGQRRNLSGRFAAAPRPIVSIPPPADIMIASSTPPRAPRFNPDMLAILQADVVSTPRRSPRHSEPPTPCQSPHQFEPPSPCHSPHIPKSKRRKRCYACNGLYYTYAEHIKTRKHQKVRAAQELAHSDQ